MILPVDWLPPDFPRRSAWHFDSFDFDARARVLSRQGERVARLTPQMTVLLESTLARAGQVCTRQELCAGLWGPDYPGADLALSNLVRKLRTLLSEPKGRAKYLETVPKLGYRFVQEPEDGTGKIADPLLAQAERLLDRRTPHAFRAAEAIFEMAAQGSPGVARPLMGLAATHLLKGAHGFAPGAESFARAEEHAKFAERYGMPQARAVAAVARFFLTGQAREARQELDELLDSGPANAAIAGALAMVRMAQGQTFEALSLLGEWRRRLTEHPGLALLDVQLRVLAGDVSGAQAVGRDFLEANPGHGTAHFLTGQTLDLAGRHSEALSNFRQARRLLPDSSGGALMEACSLAKLGRKKEARRVLEGLLETAGLHVDPFFEALARLALGERPAAEACFERARWTRSPMGPFLGVDARRVASTK